MGRAREFARLPATKPACSPLQTTEFGRRLQFRRRKLKRDLERRLGAVEARRGGRVGAILRAYDAALASMSREELIEGILDPDSRPQLFDPRILTDTELVELIAELERRSTEPGTS